jgi:pimeloyl-ACP methyl ester carboxylesterase
MPTATSADGTRIAFEVVGDGQPLILVDGAWGHMGFGPNVKLPALLAHRFRVIRYDRRGRGGSGDTSRYEVTQEIEDLEALVDLVGGSAYVYGISSGGALALAAAERLGGIDRIAVYEIPFVVDSTRAPMPQDFAAHLERLIADDRRSEAVRYFMRSGVELPAALVALMRVSPAWSKLKAVAHTAPYDAAIIGNLGTGRPLPRDRWSSVTAPTLVMAGGKSPAWLRNAMQALAAVLPNAEHRVLEGQTHVVKPKALAPVLEAFFGR